MLPAQWSLEKTMLKCLPKLPWSCLKWVSLIWLWWKEVEYMCTFHSLNNMFLNNTSRLDLARVNLSSCNLLSRSCRPLYLPSFHIFLPKLRFHIRCKSWGSLLCNCCGYSRSNVLYLSLLCDTSGNNRYKLLNWTILLSA